MSTVSQVSVHWHAGFLGILPAVQTTAQIRFRSLAAEKREDAVQETIAAACKYYQIAAAQGKLAAVRPGPLADFAVRHVRTGRHVGGRQDAAQDVLSPIARSRHGVRVGSLHRASSDDGTEGWRQVAIADRKASIPDTAAFRIDFSSWLRGLNRRDRRIIAAFASGESTSTVADRFGVSPGRVSQLRRRYERLWRAYQGEGAGRAA